mmetsp:Transcript_7761/g.16107  ORF Transcript_7761/g.16107 Transcript_7761/m.16107 type:complete len:252 (-) Transcript_7761:390-1145(-)
MQSVPVSPPPMTITSFPSAVIQLSFSHCDSSFPSFVNKSFFWFAVRNSIAKLTPFNSRPATGKSRGLVAPSVRQSASKFAFSSLTSTFLPTSALVTNSIPSSRRRLTRRSTVSFSSFMLGIPYMSRPPTRSARSNTVTLWPIWFNWSAQANPAGPDPTTATVMPVRSLGIRGVIFPSRKARSTIEYSMFLMVTGLSTSPATQDPSQGAGHTRPVNSGKLFVLCRRSMASSQWSWKTRLFHSGIRLLTGHPE